MKFAAAVTVLFCFEISAASLLVQPEEWFRSPTRTKRDDYGHHDGYEIHCKQSNTGLFALLAIPFLMMDFMLEFMVDINISISISISVMATGSGSGSNMNMNTNMNTNMNMNGGKKRRKRGTGTWESLYQDVIGNGSSINNETLSQLLERDVITLVKTDTLDSRALQQGKNTIRLHLYDFLQSIAQDANASSSSVGSPNEVLGSRQTAETSNLRHTEDFVLLGMQLLQETYAKSCQRNEKSCLHVNLPSDLWTAFSQ